MVMTTQQREVLLLSSWVRFEPRFSPHLPLSSSCFLSPFPLLLLVLHLENPSEQVMNVAWEQVTGICVDTHVHRISQRLGWTDGNKVMAFNRLPGEDHDRRHVAGFMVLRRHRLVCQQQVE